MLNTATTELIHRVLDGEASQAEAQRLQQTLAAEPAARAEYEAAQQLFADFKGVPQRHPPEGLVAAVMAAVDTPAATSRGPSQLSSSPRVLGSRWRGSAATSFPNTRPSSRFQSFLRSIDMSQQARSPFASRKIWIGGAIAVAAVVGVTQFGLEGKTDEKDVIGTIAPAQRYRAPQPSAADVAVGTTAGGQTNQADATAPADAAQKAAAEKSAEKSADLAAGKAADMAAGKAAEKSAETATGKAAEMAAGKAAVKSADMAAGKAAEMAAGKAADRSAQMATGKAAEMAANKAAEKAAADKAAK